MEKLDKEITNEDLAFEEDLLSNPYSVKSWLRYLDFKKDASPKHRFLIYERAIQNLPMSYKLWHTYLVERTSSTLKRPIDHPYYNSLNNVYERCLIHMHRMPVIWREFCTFLWKQKKITETRTTFDRALKSLPVTQHHKIWELYIPFVRDCGVTETTIRIYRRYLQYSPENVEEYVNFLLRGSHFDEAAYQLTKILDDGNFASKFGKTKYDIWMQLCEIISQNPETITKINVEKVMRAGIEKFTNEVGRLWISLANYYIGLSFFDKARDVFEESMQKVLTVRDFSLTWEAYSDFEERMLALLIEKEEEEEEEEDEKGDKEEDEDDDEDLQFQLQSARYEELLTRRPLLLNSVKLRQNPNNVQEWHKRVTLYTELEAYLDVIETYKTALKTVDPLQSSSKVSTLWINYSRFYEDNDQLEHARKIFQQATRAKFSKLDDLASIWSQWVEMEIRNQNYTEALKIIKEATNPPPRWRQLPKGAPLTDKLYRSTKLWALYADLTECFGTLEETKEVYERMIELKVVTPAFLLNYCLYLEENKHFEESFKAFQKGVEMFKFPYSMDIWITYLTKFVERYQGKEAERTRELFEQAIEEIPPSESKTFFIMYADFEEKHGLARHAMYVYDKAARTVQEEDRYMMYLLYISRATEFFGITRTRSIFEQAISSLPDKYVKDLCLKYATLEKKLGEIDRARAIYSHASQYCDPNVDNQFWEEFHNFEVAHGNEETFRNMLRIKRSVQAQYNSQFNHRLIKESQDLAKQKLEAQRNPMQLLEDKAESTKDYRNPEEIDINLGDDEDGEDEESEENLKIEQMEVPQTVFGSVNTNQGAKDRLKKVKN